jgi:hypothetical protein
MSLTGTAAARCLQIIPTHVRHLERLETSALLVLWINWWLSERLV